MAQILNHPLELRSTVGRGSRFSISVRRSARSELISAHDPQFAGDSLVGVRALCIDNERTILEGMQALLSRWGCQVELARDGAEALAKFDRFKPTILLVDYHLDDESGLDVITQLRSRSSTDIRVVVITADHGEQIEKLAQAAGYRLLRKPLKPAKLRAMLERLNRQLDEHDALIG